MNSQTNRMLWTQKAMAFVTRSHRHLWGKNNEEPLAFLFKQGLKNSFAKKLLLGWNKFGQNRPIENWGLDVRKSDHPINDPEKLYLPAGIVIPYIIDKKLRSVFIQPLEENGKDPLITAPVMMIRGSAFPTLVLGNQNNASLVVIQNLLDGLFLFQETEEKICLIIHPDVGQPIAPDIYAMIHAHENPVFLSSPLMGDSDFLPTAFKHLNQTILHYKNRQDLLDMNF